MDPSRPFRPSRWPSFRWTLPARQRPDTPAEHRRRRWNADSSWGTAPTCWCAPRPGGTCRWPAAVGRSLRPVPAGCGRNERIRESVSQWDGEKNVEMFLLTVRFRRRYRRTWSGRRTASGPRFSSPQRWRNASTQSTCRGNLRGTQIRRGDCFRLIWIDYRVAKSQVKRRYFLWKNAWPNGSMRLHVCNLFMCFNFSSIFRETETHFF